MPPSADHIERPVGEFHPFEQLRGQLVQRLQVLRHQGGGPAQGVPDPAAEDVLQQRQHLMPEPHPGEGRVTVVRVLPRHQTRRSTGRLGGRPASPRAVAGPRAAPRPHPGDRARTRTASQPEQHRLGLIVRGVREQHGAAVAPVSRSARRIPAGRIPGPPGGRLGSAEPVDRNGEYLGPLITELGE